MWLFYQPHHLLLPRPILSHFLNAFHPLCLLLPFLYTSFSNLLVLPFFLNNGKLDFLEKQNAGETGEKTSPSPRPARNTSCRPFWTVWAGQDSKFLTVDRAWQSLTEPPGASAAQPRLRMTMNKLCFPVSWETVGEMGSPRGQPPTINSASKVLSSRVSKTWV